MGVIWLRGEPLSRFNQERWEEKEKNIAALAKTCTCLGGTVGCPFDLDGNCEGVS